MSTSVKISENSKRILDTLQAKLVLAAGKKVSQQDLLDAIVTTVAEKEEELVQRIAGVKLPLSRDEVKRLMEIPTDWGIETREEEIDRYLYGSRGGPK